MRATAIGGFLTIAIPLGGIAAPSLRERVWHWLARPWWSVSAALLRGYVQPKEQILSVRFSGWADTAFCGWPRQGRCCKARWKEAQARSDASSRTPGAPDPEESERPRLRSCRGCEFRTRALGDEIEFVEVRHPGGKISRLSVPNSDATAQSLVMPELHCEAPLGYRLVGTRRFYEHHVKLSVDGAGPFLTVHAPPAGDPRKLGKQRSEDLRADLVSVGAAAGGGFSVMAMRELDGSRNSDVAPTGYVSLLLLLRGIRRPYLDLDMRPTLFVTKHGGCSSGNASTAEDSCVRSSVPYLRVLGEATLGSASKLWRVGFGPSLGAGFPTRARDAGLAKPTFLGGLFGHGSYRISSAVSLEISARLLWGDQMTYVIFDDTGRQQTTDIRSRVLIMPSVGLRIDDLI